MNANAFPGSISVWLRAAAALAIGGGAFILGNQLEESPLTESSSVPLVLQSTRGAGETTIAYASVRGKTLTLIVQAPIPPGKAAWTLTQEGRPIAQGDLEVGEGPHLRDLAFSVSGEQLEPGQGVLTLTGAEGHVIRVWEFSISR